MESDRLAAYRFRPKQKVLSGPSCQVQIVKNNPGDLAQLMIESDTRPSLKKENGHPIIAPNFVVATLTEIQKEMSVKTDQLKGGQHMLADSL